MRERIDVGRRAFIVGSAGAAGGLLIGFHIPFASRLARAGSDAGPAEVNAWILIHPDNTVVIRVARSEMGQGIFTSLPMLVAEELECDWARVRAEYASAHDHVVRDKRYVSMSTGGSRSVRESHEFLRRAGAAARTLLVRAAANSWGVPAAECGAEDGVINHAPTGRTVTFGAVASAAASLDPPEAVTLKDPKEWRLIGKPVKRLDTRAKTLAEPVFGADVRLPGMLYASIRQCPVFGGRVKALDAAAVEGLGGVRGVVSLGDAVAVVADGWWQADQALQALPVRWETGDAAGVSSDSIRQDLLEGLDTDDAAIAHFQGDADAAMAGAAKIISAEYAAPYLNHATMEPMNCTASVSEERVEVWVPTQNAEASLMTAARTAGVDPSKVYVNNTMLGGGFGRRGAFQDFVRQAVTIAARVGKPVQLQWSREEDMRHGFYRPVSMVRFQAGLDASGMPVAWKARVAGHSILASVRPGAVQEGLDPLALQGMDKIPYAVPNQLMTFSMRNSHVPVGFWRSVNHSQNAFFQECFLDELAHAGGHDPYELRRRLLADSPKELGVLSAAAERAGWGSPLPEGRHRGIAVHQSFGSYAAQVAEVSVSEDNRVRVHRVVCAIDCGHVVNPDTIAAQVESGIVFGLTAALFGDITIADGRVVEGNFDDYPMMRMGHMPSVEVHPVPSGDFWGGIGEPPVPPVAPAVCNAIFAATGVRVRELPLSKRGFQAA
jgi:isoquinoline 1-oxidoreductase beta subunit